MAAVALFHSVLGPGPGITAASDRLLAAGHDVHVIDQFDGRTFGDYETASRYTDEEVGMPALMAAALEATKDLPDGFVTMGYSNGGGMAAYVAGSRPGVVGVIMVGGAIHPKWLGITWPDGVPAQIHTTTSDPWREQEGIDAMAAAIEASGGTVEIFDYPGSGHLFDHAERTDEFDPEQAELMWSRILAFLNRIDASA